MSVTDLQERRAFVADLDLTPRATDSPAAAGRVAADEWAHYLAASIVATFPAATSPRDVQDVLNSNLLAWLAASKQTDPLADPAAWYKAYRTVLEGVGWVVDQFAFSRFDPRNDFTLLDVATARGHGQDSSAVRGLAELPAGSVVVTTFDRYSHNAHACSFQTGTAGRSDQGLGVQLTSYTVSTTEDLADPVLSTVFRPDATTVKTSTQRMRLNEGIYNTMRATVQEKLGYLSCRYIHQFPS